MALPWKCIYFLGIAALLALIGCSPSSPNYLREELANQGVMKLSHDNPFVAANMFLALEQDASPIVKKFIAHRGEPDAFEVRQRWLKPLRLYFFYMDRREAYLFEKRSISWIIKGPEAIPVSMMEQFAGLGAAKPAMAQRTAKGKPDPKLSVDEYLNDPHLPKTKTVAVTDKPLSKKKPAQAVPDPGTALQGAMPPREKKQSPPSPKKQKSKTKLQLPAAAQEPAGDFNHTVKYPGETLRIISSWFTGSPSNAGRIARINGIDNPDLLYMGQEIRVPLYLLKKSKPLPEAEVERYLQSLADAQE